MVGIFFDYPLLKWLFWDSMSAISDFLNDLLWLKTFLCLITSCEESVFFWWLIFSHHHTRLLHKNTTTIPTLLSCPWCYLALLSTLPSHPHYCLVPLLQSHPHAAMLSHHLYPTLLSCPHVTVSSPCYHLITMLQSHTHATISYPHYSLVPTLSCCPHVALYIATQYHNRNIATDHLPLL